MCVMRLCLHIWYVALFSGYLLTTKTAAEQCQCKDDIDLYQSEDSNVCFFIQSSRRNAKHSWNEQRETCNMYNATLPLLKQVGDVQDLYNLLQSLPPIRSQIFSLGLRFSNFDGIWQWLDGSSLNYSNWNESAIKVNGSACSFSTVNVFKWYTVNCDERLRKLNSIVCQFNCPAVKVTSRIVDQSETFGISDSFGNTTTITNATQATPIENERNPEGSTNTKQTLSDASIIGVTLGSIAGVAMILILILTVFRRFGNKKMEDTTDMMEQFSYDDTTSSKSSRIKRLSHRNRGVPNAEDTLFGLPSLDQYASERDSETKYSDIGSQITQPNVGSQITQPSNVISLITLPSNVGSQISPLSNISSQITSSSDIGSQASSSNIGSQIASTSNIGSQIASTSNIGSQITSTSNIDSQITPSSNTMSTTEITNPTAAVLEQISVASLNLDALNTLETTNPADTLTASTSYTF